MRKFLLNIIALSIAAVTVLCFFTWMGVRKIGYVSYRLSDDTHSIALGPSTMQGSVNDTLIAGLQNISRDGTGLHYLVPLFQEYWMRILKLIRCSSIMGDLCICQNLVWMLLKKCNFYVTNFLLFGITE